MNNWEMCDSPRKCNIWSWLILLLVLLGLGQKCSANPTLLRTDQYDFRVTFLEDFLKLSDYLPDHGIFQQDGVFGFTNIQIYPKSNSIFVSAVNNVFKLGTLNFAIQDRHSWIIPKHLIKKCRENSVHPSHCGKYQVKVFLLSNHTKDETNEDILFVCHTDGDAPSCTERNANNLTLIMEDWPSNGRCPIDPRHNVTAIIASDKHMYIGSVIDRYGQESAIIRLPLGRTKRNKAVLRTKASLTSLQISEPVSFVESFEYGPFVYFIFREHAEEFSMSCKQQTVISRIARICKSDNGDRLRMPHHWTSFMKATLSCPVVGPQGTTMFSNIQSTVVDLAKDLLYATFTTPDNGSPGSVICKYKLSELDSVFHGPFFDLKETWKPTRFNNTLKCSEYKLGIDQVSIERIRYASDYQLMFNQVQPRSNLHLVRRDGESWTHLQIDYLQRNGRIYTMYFVVTNRGSIRKLHVLKGKTCFVEEIFLSRNSVIQLNDLKLAGGIFANLIASTNSSILRLGLERCSRHKTEVVCTAAQDPYCTWNPQHQRCISIHRLPAAEANQLPAINGCPKLDIPIDGGWSPWSQWTPCHPISVSAMAGGGPRDCKCRSRSCDSPTARLGGRECLGSRVEISGCGSWWGGWTEWSACSVTCGAGLRSRQRQCLSASKVESGSGTCQGKEKDEKFCIMTPHCPVKRIGAPWGPWTDWSQCTHPCKNGRQLRSRECRPTGRTGEGPCNGTASEVRKCPNSDCPDRSALSEWTEWLKAAGSKNRQLRFRANCSAKTSVDDKSIKSEFLLQERVCRDESSCQDSGNGEANGIGVYGNWGSWSECSKNCGQGQKQRRRECSKHPCQGNAHIEEALCNVFPCKGKWGCWGEWSECSATCGHGHQTRGRSCLNQNNDVANDCPPGPRLETRTCNHQPCQSTEGWSKWAVWSDCALDGTRERRRHCLGESKRAISTDQLCRGDEFQRQRCDTGLDLITGESRYEDKNQYRLWHIIVVGIVTFISGAAVVLIIIAIIYKFKMSRTPSVNSHHGPNNTSKPSPNGTDKPFPVYPDDLDELLDDKSSYLNYPSISRSGRSQSRRVPEAPWMRQSATDDSVFLHGTLSGYRHQLPSQTSRYDLPPPEPSLTLHSNFDYPTMPLRLPSQSGMSTFGRPKKPSSVGRDLNTNTQTQHTGHEIDLSYSQI